MKVEIQLEDGYQYPDDLIVTKLICDGNDIINIIDNPAYDKIHEIFFTADLFGNSAIVLEIAKGKIIHSSVSLDSDTLHALETFFQERKHDN